MKHYLVELCDIPNNLQVQDVTKDMQMIDWSELEPRIKALGLPAKLSDINNGKPQRIAKNVWLIPSTGSGKWLPKLRQLATEFQLQYSESIRR